MVLVEFGLGRSGGTLEGRKNTGSGLKGGFWDASLLRIADLSLALSPRFSPALVNTTVFVQTDSYR